MRASATRRDQDGTVVGRIVRQRPVVAFFVLSYALSWGYWIALTRVVDTPSTSWLLILPGLWGPAVSALLLTWVSGRSVRGFLRDSLSGAGEHLPIATIAVGCVLCLSTVTNLLLARLSGVGIEIDLVSPLVAFTIAIVAGGSEEIGLRGYAHPRLRDRFGWLAAGLLVGVPWSLWHLPLQALGAGHQGPVPIFVATVLPISVLLGWLYDRSGGTVLPAVLAHAAFDTPSAITVAGQVSGQVTLIGDLFQGSVLWLVGLALIAVSGWPTASAATAHRQS